MRCHCGATLTGRRDAGGREYLYCSHWRVAGHGPRYNTAETKLLPWLREQEMPRWPLVERPPVAPDTAAAERLLKHRWADGELTDQELHDELAALRASADEAVTWTWRLSTLPFNWDDPAPAFNAALRERLEAIELDDDMKPVRAIWRKPPAGIVVTIHDNDEEGAA